MSFSNAFDGMISWQMFPIVQNQGKGCVPVGSVNAQNLGVNQIIFAAGNSDGRIIANDVAVAKRFLVGTFSGGRIQDIVLHTVVVVTARRVVVVVAQRVMIGSRGCNCNCGCRDFFVSLFWYRCVVIVMILVAICILGCL